MRGAMIIHERDEKNVYRSTRESGRAPETNYAAAMMRNHFIVMPTVSI
jgi:hypothetical protein